MFTEQLQTVQHLLRAVAKSRKKYVKMTAVEEIYIIKVRYKEKLEYVYLEEIKLTRDDFTEKGFDNYHLLDFRLRLCYCCLPIFNCSAFEAFNVDGNAKYQVKLLDNNLKSLKNDEMFRRHVKAFWRSGSFHIRLEIAAHTTDDWPAIMTSLV